MSELKLHLMLNKEMYWMPVYLKVDADKVIAELKDKLQASDKQIENLINSASSIMLSKDMANDNACAELRHSKYKRCLAMAKWCFTKSNYHFVLARHGEDGEENNRKSILYAKWHKHWLELAKKFKGASE